MTAEVAFFGLTPYLYAPHVVHELGQIDPEIDICRPCFLGAVDTEQKVRSGQADQMILLAARAWL
jgi:hypothetical protein